MAGRAAWHLALTPVAGNFALMTNQDMFTVMAFVRQFAWGGTYRLRLDAAVRRAEAWLGTDMLGAPALRNRVFDRPKGWEKEVTLLGRHLQPGDRIAVDDVIKDAQLWVEGQGRVSGQDRA